MRRGLIILAVLVVLARAGGAVYLTAFPRPPPLQYSVVFDDAFNLVPQGEVRIGGVKAGSMSDVVISGGDPPKAIAHIELTQPGFGELHADAFCESRPQSLISSAFIECQPGKSKRLLKPGSTVPVNQTASYVGPDLIMDIMRLPYRERFRVLLSELGVGLAGRPGELNATIR